MQNILHQNEPLNMRQCVELSDEENDGKLLFQRTEKKMVWHKTLANKNMFCVRIREYFSE